MSCRRSAPRSNRSKTGGDSRTHREMIEADTRGTRCSLTRRATCSKSWRKRHIRVLRGETEEIGPQPDEDTPR